MRTLTVAFLLLLGAACSDDGDSGEPESDSGSVDTEFIDGFEGERVEDYKGHAVKVDEENRTVAIDDCDLAKELTASGAEYGPSGGETGYGYTCP